MSFIQGNASRVPFVCRMPIGDYRYPNGHRGSDAEPAEDADAIFFPVGQFDPVIHVFTP